MDPVDLERMRREHVRMPRYDCCAKCYGEDSSGQPLGDWPCDAARLLAHIDAETEKLRQMVRPFAVAHHDIKQPGIAYGLLGPATNEELR